MIIKKALRYQTNKPMYQDLRKMLPAWTGSGEKSFHEFSKHYIQHYIQTTQYELFFVRAEALSSGNCVMGNDACTKQNIIFGRRS